MKRTFFYPILWLIILVMATPCGATRLHGHSIHGHPKYGENFKHFDYVNPDAPKGGVVTFAATGTFDTLNPFGIKGVPGAGLTMLHPSYLHATLMASSCDEPFSHYGYIAESIEMAPDNSWVIFNLRENAQFHNGKPILAQDVIATFHALRTKGNPLYRSYYKDVQTVEKVSDSAVKFGFSAQKNRELPMILGEMPVLSRDFLETNDLDKADLTIPVGSGPYKIREIKPGHRIIYERIKNWWGENLPVNKGRYNFDRIIYDYYRDGQIAFEAFKSGAIDFRIENVAKNWATGYNFPLFRDGKIKRQEIVLNHPEPMSGVTFNLRRAFFQDQRIRQAINYCFDFEWINRNLFYSLYKRTASFFEHSELGAKGKPGAAELAVLAPFRDKVPKELLSEEFIPSATDGSGNIRRQLGKAQDLFRQAGYEIRHGKMVSSQTGKPFSFSIMLPSAQMERVYQGFIGNLKKLGIDARLQIVDTAQFALRVDNYDYDMLFAIYPQSLNPGNEQRDFWHSSSARLKGTHNYAGIEDPVIDVIVEKVITANNREELITLTKVLDRLLLWGFYLVPGYHNKANFLAFNSKLVSPAGFMPDDPSSTLFYRIDIDSWWVEPSSSQH